MQDYIRLRIAKAYREFKRNIIKVTARNSVPTILHHISLLIFFATPWINLPASLFCFHRSLAGQFSQIFGLEK